MQTNTDQDLIQMTIEGHTRAFGHLVQRYEAYVFTIVFRMVRVREEAEEVSQDTFIKAFESIGSFRGESKFSSWLYSIAYRKALDHLRKNKRYKAWELKEEITEDKAVMVENALHRLVAKERKEKIQECIIKLPEIDAALITLYYFDEQSIKEIAAITKLSEDNIKVKLYRSRKKLFSLLEQYMLPKIANTNGKAI